MQGDCEEGGIATDQVGYSSLHVSVPFKACHESLESRGVFCVKHLGDHKAIPFQYLEQLGG